jgi:hypothetical protein
LIRYRGAIEPLGADRAERPPVRHPGLSLLQI